MTDKRTKNKFSLDTNRNLYNNNDLKRKYNYRKIPINKNHNLNEKYSSNTERPIKYMVNTTRKQYKKRLILNQSPISINNDEFFKILLVLGKIDFLMGRIILLVAQIQ